MKLNNITFILFSVLILTGCEKVFIEQPANNPEAVFENIWTTFYEEYAPFEERNADWNKNYDTFRPLVNSHTSDDELFRIISDMLGTLNDGHVSLTAPGRDIYYSNNVRRELIDDALFNLNVIKTYLDSDYESGVENSYIYGKIKGENVGYIYFDHVADNLFKLNDFLDKYPDVNGYIIDLRHNQGGDFTYCFSEIGRLTDQERFVFKSKTKIGKGDNDYDEWHDWKIKPNGKFVNKPIIVLTDRYTISAGERSVMAFQTLPNITTMGDTTNGAHGTMIGRELANGWFYSLVPQKVITADGKSYEGIGLAPDILIKNSLNEINSGKDQIIETAINKLK